MGTNQGATVPTLYRPALVLFTGLVMLAMVMGFLAGALGDAAHAGDLGWVIVFLILLAAGLLTFGWVTFSLTTFVSDDPVDAGVDDGLGWSYDDDPWYDHHSGDN